MLKKSNSDYILLSKTFLYKLSNLLDKKESKNLLFILDKYYYLQTNNLNKNVIQDMSKFNLKLNVILNSPNPFIFNDFEQLSFETKIRIIIILEDICKMP